MTTKLTQRQSRHRANQLCSCEAFTQLSVPQSRSTSDLLAPCRYHCADPWCWRANSLVRHLKVPSGGVPDTLHPLIHNYSTTIISSWSQCLTSRPCREGTSSAKCLRRLLHFDVLRPSPPASIGSAPSSNWTSFDRFSSRDDCSQPPGLYALGSLILLFASDIWEPTAKWVRMGLLKRNLATYTLNLLVHFQ